MWYFTWILGLAFAAVFGAANALWMEFAPNGQAEPPERP